MQHAYRAGAVFAWLGLMVGGCAAISGLSGITEEACAPNCDADAGGTVLDGGKTPLPDGTMSAPDTGRPMSDDSPAGSEDSPPASSNDATTDAPADSPAISTPEAATDAPVTDAHPSTDAPASTTSMCGGDTCASAEDAGCCGSECPFSHNYNEDLTPAATFYDCVAVGTYNLTLALDACAAFTGDGSQCDSAGTYGCNVTLNGQDAGVGDMVCSDGPSASVCDCWGYSGPIVGYVSKGAAKGSAACGCPDPQGGTKWK